jgi:hypothetical protein
MVPVQVSVAGAVNSKPAGVPVAAMLGWEVPLTVAVVVTVIV